VKRACIALFLGVLAVAGPASAAGTPFRLANTDGSLWVSPGGFAGRPSLFLFWDTECAPCLRELADMANLKTAFPDAVFVVVSLSPRDDTRRALGEYGVPSDVVRAQAPVNPRGLLASIGNRAGTLPFSAAFDGQGRLCASGTGTLTRERLHAIATMCR